MCFQYLFLLDQSFLSVIKVCIFQLNLQVERSLRFLKNEAPIEQIRSKLKQVGFDDFQVQRFGSSKDVLIKVPLDDEKKI